MKKIICILTLVILTSCSWNYKNGDIKNNIDSEETKKLEQELIELEEQKAREILEKIEIENEIASEVLQNFLNSEDFDLKAEIERTKQKYGDTLGPILEYEHEKTEEESGTGLTQTGSIGTGVTNTGSIGTGNIISDNNSLIYSGETLIADDNINSETVKDDSDKEYTGESEIKKIDEKTTSFTELTKTGRSGSYTMYSPNDSSCSGGLEMIKTDGSKTWLFENTCEKMMYDFVLAVGGINVFYRDENGVELQDFVSIK